MSSPKNLQNFPENSQSSPLHVHYDLSPSAEANECEFDYSELEKEQEVIDKGLNFLLNFKHKKPVGRPSKTNSTETSSLKVPDFVNPTLKSITNINELHPGVLLDYLVKINTFNKKILQHCNDLNIKVKTLSDKVDDNYKIHDNIPPNLNISTQPRPSSQPNEEITATIDKSEHLELKLDALEQKSLSNVLTCSGDFVGDVCDIGASTSTTSGNNRNLMTAFTDKLKLLFVLIIRLKIEY